MPSKLFHTKGRLILKVFETCFSIEDEELSVSKSSSMRKSSFRKPKSLTSVLLQAHVKILSMDSGVLYENQAQPSSCYINPKLSSGNCLIGEEVDMENIPASSVIQITIDFMPELPPPVKNEIREYHTLGFVEIPIERMDVDIVINQWYQLLHPQSREGLKSTVRVEVRGLQCLG